MFDWFVKYPYIVYAIVTWLYVFSIIKPPINKQFFTTAILSVAVLVSLVEILIINNVYKFSQPIVLNIVNIPLFFAIWGAGSGIMFFHYLGTAPIRRFFMVALFAGVTVGLESIVEAVHRVQHIGKFNNLHEFILDMFVLSTLSFILTNLFPKSVSQY